MNRKRIHINILKHLVSILACSTVVLPFYLVVINSFKSKNEAARMSLSFPTEWKFENYLVVIEKGKLISGFFNSMTYSLVSTILGVLLCSMGAYVISRKNTKLNNFLYYFILCGMFFPINFITLIKSFQFMGLTDSRAGVIIVFLSSMIPFCIFVIKNFVSSIPRSLDEAATIDGAGPVGLFFRIIFPLLKPAAATCFVLQFMTVWSDFLVPLYLTSSSKLFPMTMAVYQFFGRNERQWNYVFADIVLTVIPVLIIYMIGQKYFISGMTSGAVKQ